MTKPDRDLYRRIAYHDREKDSAEKEHIRAIFRHIYRHYGPSFEQFYKEENVMVKTFDDFVNEMAEEYIKELKTENDQFRAENDQFREENDQYRKRIAELEAQLAAR